MQCVRNIFFRNISIIFHFFVDGIDSRNKSVGWPFLAWLPLFWRLSWVPCPGFLLAVGLFIRQTRQTSHLADCRRYPAICLNFLGRSILWRAKPSFKFCHRLRIGQRGRPGHETFVAVISCSTGSVRLLCAAQDVTASINGLWLSQLFKRENDF